MAAKKILISYNFNQNELQNAVAHITATDPVSPVDGQFWYNSTGAVIKWQANGVTVDPLSRAFHTGTQAWGTITGTPTTLAGYGISDAAPSTHVGSNGVAQHALVVSSGNAGFMSGTDKAKLDGVAAGATANQTDTYLLDRAHHTGTQTASTISDFTSTAVAIRLDQFAAPTAALNVNNQQLSNVANGTNASDAVNLAQLNAVANGTDWKASARVATTANITLSGAQTVDGVTLTNGDRVLVKNQSTASQNGIYSYNSGGGWTRTTDANTTGQITASTALFVDDGTVNGGTQWRCSNTTTPTIGTDPITFAQFGAAVSYSNGFGLNLSGTVFSLNTAVAVTKYAADIGNGSATSITVTHNLGTKDITASVRQNVDDAFVDCDIVATSTTQATFTFAVAPASNALRVVVHG